MSTSSSQKSNTSNKKKWIRSAFRTAAKFVLWFVIVSIVWVVALKWLNPPFTYLMLKRKIEASINGKPSQIGYRFISYKNISSNLKMAVIASEDQKFADHHGFDFEAIDKAITKNKRSKRKRGASTISQQTAKNIFLWDSRNFVRKGLEVYFTALIELIWGKERILEVYLNVAEMGNLTFGAEAASQKYFKKKAKTLSLDEASSIASVLPNPIFYKVKSPTKYIIKKKAWIKNQVNSLGGKKYLDEL